VEPLEARPRVGLEGLGRVGPVAGRADANRLALRLRLVTAEERGGEPPAERSGLALPAPLVLLVEGLVADVGAEIPQRAKQRSAIDGVVVEDAPDVEEDDVGRRQRVAALLYCLTESGTKIARMMPTQMIV
jgi:hypothetical protein